MDGTTIAGPKICAEYVKLLELQEGQKVLDLGCSFGRMFPVLREKTSRVFGMDLDPQVVAEAAKKPYVQVLSGRAEDTGFEAEFFDAVLAWAVFDVVEQNLAFVEMNRILKNHGRLLVTGKNTRYPLTDRLGFVAERNAYLKKFPNRFTDLKLLTEKISDWGFQIRYEFLFSQRGDFGLNQVNTSVDPDKAAYEFLLVLEKTKNLSGEVPDISLTQPISLTAQRMSWQAGFSDVNEFFKNSADEENAKGSR